MSETVKLFSTEWCAEAGEVWKDVVIPNLLDPDNLSYVVEWKAIDTEAICQLVCKGGNVVEWEPGVRYSEDECGIILHATAENWQKIGNGKLDPIGGIAAQRLHLKKGPMAVVIKEAEAFKKLLVGFGRIPTDY